MAVFPQRRPGASLSRSPDLVLPSGSAATLHGSSGNRRLFCLESGGARSWCEPSRARSCFSPGCLICPLFEPLRTRGGGPCHGCSSLVPWVLGPSHGWCQRLASPGLEPTPPSCWLFSFFCYQSLDPSVLLFIACYFSLDRAFSLNV